MGVSRERTLWSVQIAEMASRRALRVRNPAAGSPGISMRTGAAPTAASLNSLSRAGRR